MKDCGCEKHGVGVVAGPCIPQKPCKQPANSRWKTVVLPASVGTDASGQPYAPELGAYTNTIVKYLANGAVYLYDTRGVYTNVKDATTDNLAQTLEEIQDQLDELYTPAKIAQEVPTYADLLNVVPSTVPSGEMVYVESDEKHNGEQSNYFYDAAQKQWVYAGIASPYVRKEVIKNLVDQINVAITSTAQMLQTNINAEVNARETDRDNLQENINREVNARELADTNLSNEIDVKVAGEAEARENADNNLQTQLDALVASTDVKDVVGTKAELEAYDTSTLGNNDIIKVLNDESENGAITYYRWSTADNKFTLIGETGPYYTKAEANEEFATKAEVGAIDTTKLNELADIKTIGDNLELTEDGTLNSTGGVELYSTFSTAEDGANTAAFINEKLNGAQVLLGNEATVSNSSGESIVIGHNAHSTALSPYTSVVVGRATSAYNGCTAVGNDAHASGFYGTAVGASASVKSYSVSCGVNAMVDTNSDYSVALGNNSKVVSRQSTVSIGDGSANSNYGTRFLANVRAGELDTDAVNVKQMQDYVAENTGGSSVALYSDYSTATDGANTAKFINDKLNTGRVIIGSGAIGTPTANWSCVVIGDVASATGVSSISIGNGTRNVYERSIALGSQSRCRRNDELSIGSGSAGSGVPISRYLANVKAGENPTDAVNLTQLREATMGTVLYAAADHEAVITLSQNVSQFERVRAIGSWALPYQTGELELQVFGEYQLNDQDQAKTFQLHAQDFDPETGEKTEITDTWTFTNPTTLSLVSSITVSGPLTDPVVTTNDTPAINLRKVIGYPVV